MLKTFCPVPIFSIHSAMMSTRLMNLAMVSVATATRAEVAALLQSSAAEINMLQTEGGSRMDRLANLEQQVMAFAKSGVPDDAKPFLSQIKTLLETDIMDSIMRERNLHEGQHGSALEAFTTAGSTYDSTKASIETNQQPATAAAKNTHGVCRTAEGADYQETVVCDGEEAADQATYNGAEAAVKQRADAASSTCVDSDTYDWREGDVLSSAALRAYAGAIDTWSGDRTTLNSKIAECNGLDGELAAQKATCDGDQTQYEQDACAESLAWQAARTAYDGSYLAAKNAFEGSFSTWTEQSGDREFQCKLVNTLVCYIDALDANDDQGALQSAADACASGRDGHDCSAVTFTHQDTPAAQTLDAVPVAPCDAAFDYGVFPEGTAKADCTACEGINE